MSENARIYGPDAWRVAAVYSLLSVVFTALLFVFPELRRFPLPSGNVFPIAALTSILPLLTLVWGGIGFIRRKNGEDGRLCAMSIAAGGICMTVVGYVCWKDFIR